MAFNNTIALAQRYLPLLDEVYKYSSRSAILDNPNVQFIGGCRGNTQGVARLAEGMEATEVVKRLKGIECRGDNSCPNQLALAVEANL